MRVGDGRTSLPPCVQRGAALTPRGPSQGRVAVWGDAQEAAAGRHSRGTDDLGCHQLPHCAAGCRAQRRSETPRARCACAWRGAASHWPAQAGSSKHLSSMDVPLPGCLGNQAQKAPGCRWKALATRSWLPSVRLVAHPVVARVEVDQVPSHCSGPAGRLCRVGTQNLNSCQGLEL